MMPRIPLSGPLGLSLAAMLLVLVFLLASVPSLLVAAFGPGTGASEPGERIASLTAAHEKNVKTSQERFNGRSAFFRPPPKYVPPPPPPPEEVRAPEPPPGPPPPPIQYTGPSLKAIMGDTAWFMANVANDPPVYLKVGETDSKSGVTLVSTNPPWSVHVTHKGGEYDVDLFKRSWEQFLSSNSSAPRVPVPGLLIMPQIETPASAVAPGDSAARNTGRTVATPVIGPLTPGPVEPNAKVEAAKEEDDDEAETEEAEDEGGEEPTAEDEDPEEPADEGEGEAPPELAQALRMGNQIGGMLNNQSLRMHAIPMIQGCMN